MNEDFVPFELAKKLKEKGFNVPCIYAYCEKGGWNSYTQKHEPITYILRTDGNPFGAYYTGNNWNKEYKPNKNKIRCSAPTIHQVLKWLRKEKNIDVEIRTEVGMLGDKVYVPFISTYTEFTFETSPDVVRYRQKKFNPTSPLPHEIIPALTYFKEWEEAALAAIEYALDNVI